MLPSRLRKLIPHRLTAGIRQRGIRSLIGFGIPVRTLSHPVLYLRASINRRDTSISFGENQLSRGLISLSLLHTAHQRIFQHPPVRTSIWYYPSFILAMCRSPPLRVYSQQLVALFRLAFASPPLVIPGLGLPLTITRRLIMQKASRHRTLYCTAPTPCKHRVSGSISLP